MSYSINTAVQHFDDDIRGPVPFMDRLANTPSVAAHVSDITLLIKVPPQERRLLKKAIIDDINEDLKND